MAETGKEEVGGGNEVNDPPEWCEDATKDLKNGGKQMESPVKEKNLGLMKTFRASLKAVSPMALKNKRSENTDSDQSQASNTPLRPQSSPSLSRGSPSQSSFRSPKAEKASVTRTMSDSAVGITGTLAKRGASIRQSLGLSTKKHKQEPLQPVTEAMFSTEELRSDSVASMDKVLELRDTYTLPEIPPLPLSVMEINKLIEMEVLEEAYVNLLSLRLELQRERQALDQEDCPIELVHKEKDLSLLYGTLRNKMSAIVRNSSALPLRNQELLVYVAQIILEEEKRQGEPGAMQGWREAWRDAVRDGARDILKKVHLDSHERNASWLAVHLGLLGKAVVEDLERVKTELLSSYPADFNVFETYVSCHHEAVGEHLKRLLEKVTELKDYYALLDFIIHRYPSDLKDNQNNLTVEEELINKIKTSYCHCQMDDFKSALENIVTSEKEMWTMKKSPDRTDEGFLTSKTYMTTCQLIASYAGNLEKIDENMVKSVVRFCLEELNQFHTRFEEEFLQHTHSLLTSDLLDCYLWIEYHISYINSFNSLKENVQCYREICSSQVEQLEKEVDGLIQRLSQTLIKHFKTDVKPYMDGMMTKKWLKTNEDFKEVTSRIENYCGLCKSMRAPSAQPFVNDVHYYVAREYVSQLMKKKYSCKKNKNEDAAIKLREQWDELKKLFEDMGSSLNWLYPLGDYLSDIIGMENERKIKDLLIPLVSNYPDISKKQLSAVLYFRDNGFSLERHSVINQFSVLKRDAGNTDHDRSFFTDIE